MIWMISANGKMYDHASSFATNGFIDWRQRAKYSIGDIVYIYCTRPFMRVMYKCEVVRHSVPFSDCVDDAVFWIDRNEYEKSKAGDYARLKLLEQVDTPHLSLDALKNHGLSAAPQGPIKVSAELHSYIEKHFNDYYSEGYFTDVDDNEKYHEGHVRSVKVDIYERSSIARGKCIEHYGTSCLICGLNFGDTYGELGEGFIHIHHLKPLHTIRKDYVVDYKKDLIPVCPNCHAMIHRIPGGDKMTTEEIRDVLKVTETSNRNVPIIRNQAISSSQNITLTSTVVPEQSHQNTISKIEDEVIQKIKVGTTVTHKTFGTGKIKSIDSVQKHIVVSFLMGDKVFIYPDAINKGFIALS